MMRYFFCVCFFLLLAPFASAQTFESAVLSKVIRSQTHGLKSSVMKCALHAYTLARESGKDPRGILTIVDYSLPSTKPRLWVIDLLHERVLYHVLVAHGHNSGLKWAYRFSNRPHSRESSLGLFETGDTYEGEYGYSLRVKGLEAGFNDNAEKREIVFHPAGYVSPKFAKTFGRLGRSYGCFALNPDYARSIINTIKDGTLVFAYYPETHWLEDSVYL